MRKTVFQPCLILLYAFALWRFVKSFDYSGALFSVNAVMWGLLLVGLTFTILFGKFVKMSATLTAIIGLLSFASGFMAAFGLIQECSNKTFSSFIYFAIGFIFMWFTVQLIRFNQRIKERSKQLLS